MKPALAECFVMQINLAIHYMKRTLFVALIWLLTGCEKEDETCYECVTTTTKFVSATAPLEVTSRTAVQCGRETMERYRLANTLINPSGATNTTIQTECTAK